LEQTLSSNEYARQEMKPDANKQIMSETEEMQGVEWIINVLEACPTLVIAF